MNFEPTHLVKTQFDERGFPIKSLLPSFKLIIIFGYFGVFSSIFYFGHLDISQVFDLFCDLDVFLPYWKFGGYCT